MNVTKSKVKNRRILTARKSGRLFLCAYGNQIRMTAEAKDPTAAARQCFGVVDGVTVLPIKKWKDASAVERQDMREELMQKHATTTGVELRGKK